MRILHVSVWARAFLLLLIFILIYKWLAFIAFCESIQYDCSMKAVVLNESDVIQLTNASARFDFCGLM